MINSVVKAKSARTRIREALAYQLKSIRKNAGYANDIVDVRFIAPSMEDIKIYPTVVALMGDERTLDAQTASSTFNRIQKELSVVLLVFINERTDTSLAQDKVIQDIERLIGEHHGLEHPDGDCTCFLAQVSRTRPFGMAPNKPSVGVSVTLTIRYQQSRTDPTQKV